MKKVIFFLILLVVSGCNQQPTMKIDQSNEKKIIGLSKKESQLEMSGEEVKDLLNLMETKISVNPNKDGAQIQIGLKNNHSEAVALMFSSGQTYEVVVTNSENHEVYRFSVNRFFTQALREIKIEAGEEKTWQASWDYKDNNGVRVPTGEYTVTASIVAYQLNNVAIQHAPFQAKTVIQVP